MFVVSQAKWFEYLGEKGRLTEKNGQTHSQTCSKALPSYTLEELEPLSQLKQFNFGDDCSVLRKDAPPCAICQAGPEQIAQIPHSCPHFIELQMEQFHEAKRKWDSVYLFSKLCWPGSQEPFAVGEILKELPCQHGFHQGSVLGKCEKVNKKKNWTAVNTFSHFQQWRRSELATGYGRSQHKTSCGHSLLVSILNWSWMEYMHWAHRYS